jgi:raffinose/stachyose/melibiose transport system substrate-binding protein
MSLWKKEECMNRKTLSKILVLTAVFVFLGFSAFAADTVLEFWSWNNEGAYPVVHADAQARFEAAHPGVTVKREYISYGDYMVKVKAVLTGGEAPDVFQIPWAGEYPELARSGRILPLTDYLKKGFPAFFPNIMKAISVDGQAWSVPLDLNTLQIAYNKTMFEKLGLAVPKSRDELVAMAKKLDKEGKFAVAMGTKDLWSAADVFFAQIAYTDASHTKMALADSGKMSWNSPEFLKAAQAVADYVKQGVIAPGANSMEVFVGAENLFVQQEAAMFYPVGNFVTGGITEKVGDSFEWSLFPWPPLVKGGDSLPTGGVAEMFVVSKDSKNRDLAVEFLRYMTNDEGKDVLVKNDFIPSSAYKGSAAMSPLYKNMLDAQSKSQSRVVYNTTVYSACMNGMQGIIGATLTPQQFIDSLVKAAKK